jgi:hypothetical protein
MATVDVRAPEFTLALNEQERVDLLSYLEQGLRDVMVEVHRTEAPDYREFVQRKEAMLRGVIDKLRRP